MLFYTTYATLWQGKTELAVHEWVKLIGEACMFKISDRPTLKTQRHISSRVTENIAIRLFIPFFGGVHDCPPTLVFNMTAHLKNVYY